MTRDWAEGRWIKHLDGRPLTRPIWVPPGCRYSDEFPHRFFRWCETNLRFTTGVKAGERLAWSDWQIDEVFRPTLGLYEVGGDGQPVRRLIRILYLFVPRGAAKTEMAAVLGLYDLTGQWDTDLPGQLRGQRASPEVDLFASSREQAARMWEAVERLVVHSEGLDAEINVKTSQRRAMNRRTAATMVVRTGVAKNEVGLNPSTMLLDEVLAQRDRSLYDVCDTSMGKRPDQLWMQMTTASPEPETFAEANHDGMVDLAEDRETADPTVLPIIYQAPANTTIEQAGDPKLWREVQPALDAGYLDESVYRRAHTTALRDPAARAGFFCYRLNIFGASPTAFFGSEAWDDCIGDIPDLVTLAGCPSYAAVDMSLTNDIASLCTVTYVDEDTAVAQWEHWITPATDDALVAWTGGRWLAWREEPELRVAVTETNMIPLEPIADRLNTIAKVFDVRSIGYDSFRAGGLARLLSGLPHQHLNTAAWALRAALTEAGNLVSTGRLVHNGDPLARWSALVARVKLDADGNPRLVRGDTRVSNKRIDPASALVMALDRRLAEQRTPEPEASGGAAILNPFSGEYIEWQ